MKWLPQNLHDDLREKTPLSIWEEELDIMLVIMLDFMYETL